MSAGAIGHPRAHHEEDHQRSSGGPLLAPERENVLSRGEPLGALPIVDHKGADGSGGAIWVSPPQGKFSLF